jgi:RNA polymerase sigma-70 factor (ECF subfamily)
VSFGRETGNKTEGIIMGLRRHDPRAIGDLYDLLGRKVYSVILAIVRNPKTAEDLLQETFVRVWNGSREFTGDASALTAWLVAIGRHRALDHIRAAAQRRGDEGAANPESTSHANAVIGIAKVRVDLSESEGVREEIRRLPPQQRKVIELAYYEGLSPTGIAERLNEPPDVVKAWTRTALARLRSAVRITNDSGSVPGQTGGESGRTANRRWSAQ